MRTSLVILLFLGLAPAAHAQVYTSRGSNDSEPGDTMYRMPDRSSVNITQDDARQRAADRQNETDVQQEWRQFHDWQPSQPTSRDGSLHFDH